MSPHLLQEELAANQCVNSMITGSEARSCIGNRYQRGLHVCNLCREVDLQIADHATYIVSLSCVGRLSELSELFKFLGPAASLRLVNWECGCTEVTRLCIAWISSFLFQCITLNASYVFQDACFFLSRLFCILRPVFAILITRSAYVVSNSILMNRFILYIAKYLLWFYSVLCKLWIIWIPYSTR